MLTHRAVKDTNGGMLNRGVLERDPVADSMVNRIGSCILGRVNKIPLITELLKLGVS